jgi:hypothetical protein
VHCIAEELRLLERKLGAAIAFVLLSALAATAAPVTLKLAFFSSERSLSYIAGIKPFIEALNAEGKDLVEVLLYAGGMLGHDVAKQPRKYSGTWAAVRFIEANESAEGQIMERLRADPHRNVVVPAPSDLDQAQIAFRSIIEDWAGRSEYNRKLLSKAEAIVSNIRLSNATR